MRSKKRLKAVTSDVAFKKREEKTIQPKVPHNNLPPRAAFEEGVPAKKQMQQMSSQDTLATPPQAAAPKSLEATSAQQHSKRTKTKAKEQTPKHVRFTETCWAPLLQAPTVWAFFGLSEHSSNLCTQARLAICYGTTREEIAFTLVLSHIPMPMFFFDMYLGPTGLVQRPWTGRFWKLTKCCLVSMMTSSFTSLHAAEIKLASSKRMVAPKWLSKLWLGLDGKEGWLTIPHLAKQKYIYKINPNKFTSPGLKEKLCELLWIWGSSPIYHSRLSATVLESRGKAPLWESNRSTQIICASTKRTSYLYRKRMARTPVKPLKRLKKHDWQLTGWV